MPLVPDDALWKHLNAEKNGSSHIHPNKPETEPREGLILIWESECNEHLVFLVPIHLINSDQLISISDTDIKGQGFKNF